MNNSSSYRDPYNWSWPDILLAKPSGDNPLTDSFSYSQRFYQTAVGPMVCRRQNKLHSVVFAGFAATSLASRIVDPRAKLVIAADAGILAGNLALELCLQD
jgi:hypothetical protein